MMLGIYTSVVNTTFGAERLALDHFMRVGAREGGHGAARHAGSRTCARLLSQVRKLTFPPGGSLLTPPHSLPQAFKFKDYSPEVFHHIRQRFAIDQRHYLNSLGGAYEYIEFNSNSKSGSFFFYSHDGKFMIKTQSPAESKFLRRILAHYYQVCVAPCVERGKGGGNAANRQHARDLLLLLLLPPSSFLRRRRRAQYVMSNPHTYITRFYGMHRIKMPHLRRKIHFVVMQSVFHGDNEIHEMYDLKGSTVGRRATDRERARGPSRCVFKDCDLEDNRTTINLGPGRREAFLAQLTLDADFLRRMAIMDYSLLLGIHYRSRRHTAQPHMLAHSPGGPAAGGVTDEGAALESPAPAGAVGAAGGEGAGGPSRGEDAVAAVGFAGGDAPLGAGTGLTVGAGAAAPTTPAPTRALGRVSSARPAGASPPHPGMTGATRSWLARAAASSGGAAGDAVAADAAAVTVAAAARAGGVLGLSRSTLGGAGGGGGDDGANLFIPPQPDPRAGMGIPGMDWEGGGPTDEVYYLGIIDILQQYDLRKMGETALRALYQRVDDISAVSPPFYAQRFVNFIAKHSR
jgi:hypothetical protein